MSHGLIALFLVVAAAQPGVTSFQNTQFDMVMRLESLPVDLRHALDQVIRGERIANPEEQFEATDVIHYKSLPRRRLIFAGVSRKVSFVHYEHGGRGLHQHLLIFARHPESGVQLLENLSMAYGVAKRPARITELKALIAGGNAAAASKGEA